MGIMLVSKDITAVHFCPNIFIKPMHIILAKPPAELKLANTRITLHTQHITFW